MQKGKETLLQFLGVRKDLQQSDLEFKRMVENLSFILKFIVKSGIEIVLLNEKATEIYNKDTFKTKTDNDPLAIVDY